MNSATYDPVPRTPRPKGSVAGGVRRVGKGFGDTQTRTHPVSEGSSLGPHARFVPPSPWRLTRTPKPSPVSSFLTLPARAHSHTRTQSQTRARVHTAPDQRVRLVPDRCAYATPRHTRMCTYSARPTCTHSPRHTCVYAQPETTTDARGRRPTPSGEGSGPTRTRDRRYPPPWLTHCVNAPSRSDCAAEIEGIDTVPTCVRSNPHYPRHEPREDVATALATQRRSGASTLTAGTEVPLCPCLEDRHCVNDLSHTPLRRPERGIDPDPTRAPKPRCLGRGHLEPSRRGPETRHSTRDPLYTPAASPAQRHRVPTRKRDTPHRPGRRTGTTRNHPYSPRLHRVLSHSTPLRLDTSEHDPTH